MAQLAFIALLALFAVLSPIATSADPKTDLITVSSLSKDFSDVCEYLGPYIPLPYAKTDQLCATTGFRNSSDMCIVLRLIEQGLMNLLNGKDTYCSGSKQTPAATTSLQGRVPTSLSHHCMDVIVITSCHIWKMYTNTHLPFHCVCCSLPRCAPPVSFERPAAPAYHITQQPARLRGSLILLALEGAAQL